ncbi:MAG: SCO family protein [Rhodanobacter sp.]|jgi:protein SCO1/2|nr:SCO family protein [Rhodanobacter sp.]
MNVLRLSGRIRATVLILIAMAAIAAGGWFGVRTSGAPDWPKLEAAAMYPAPRALPDFQLTASDGRPLTAADWKGHWTLVFFGYTSCPDVCPTTLATFKQVWNRLATAAARIRFTFVSVDPQRDTPEQLARYVEFFNKEFVGATGSDEELVHLTRALGLTFSREKTGDDNYTVEHSAAVLIVDPQGRQAGLFRPPFDAAKIAADLQRLVVMNSVQGGT